MKPILFALLALAACARPLTPTEAEFLTSVHGPTVQAARVRIHDGALIGGLTFLRPPRPWQACRERIHPREEGPEVPTSIFGFMLGNHLFVARKHFSTDYLAGYPDALPLTHAMIFAHEMTHVWQWQNRDFTGYAPWKAAGEHAVSDDPYLFEIGTQDFLSYPYEQQAALVEEFVCCRALDPDGARTGRLHDLLSPVFPSLPRQSRAAAVILPWVGVEPDGICS